MNRSQKNRKRPAEDAADTAQKAPRQLAFSLPLEPGMGREDFLVTESNRAAFEAVTRWPATPDDAHALALIGPPGSGRTHLAEIWRTDHDALKAAPADLSVETVPTLLSRGTAGGGAGCRSPARAAQHHPPTGCESAG